MITLTIPDDVEQELKIVAENSHMTITDFIFSLLRNAVKPSVDNSEIQLRALFKETQHLPTVRLLNDADIEAEIRDYRNGL
jgi:hypothetical protein